MSNEVSAEEEKQKANRRYQEAMPKLDIALGTIFQIKLSPVAGARSFPGEYVGVEHYKYLILRLPSIPGLRNSLLQHTLAEVQFQVNGSVNSFYAEVISHTVKPAFLLFITYPDRLSILELREHQRVTCALPCSIHSEFGDGVGLIADISKGGCKAIFSPSGKNQLKNIAKDTPVVLDTFLSSITPALSTPATVKGIETSGGNIVLGLGFGENPEFAKHLTGYVNDIQTLL